MMDNNGTGTGLVDTGNGIGNLLTEDPTKDRPTDSHRETIDGLLNRKQESSVVDLRSQLEGVKFGDLTDGKQGWYRTGMVYVAMALEKIGYGREKREERRREASEVEVQKVQQGLRDYYESINGGQNSLFSDLKEMSREVIGLADYVNDYPTLEANNTARLEELASEKYRLQEDTVTPSRDIRSQIRGIDRQIERIQNDQNDARVAYKIAHKQFPKLKERALALKEVYELSQLQYDDVVDSSTDIIVESQNAIHPLKVFESLLRTLESQEKAEGIVGKGKSSGMQLTSGLYGIHLDYRAQARRPFEEFQDREDDESDKILNLSDLLHDRQSQAHRDSYESIGSEDLEDLRKFAV